MNACIFVFVCIYFAMQMVFCTVCDNKTPYKTCECETESLNHQVKELLNFIRKTKFSVHLSVQDKMSQEKLQTNTNFAILANLLNEIKTKKECDSEKYRNMVKLFEINIAVCLPKSDLNKLKVVQQKVLNTKEDIRRVKMHCKDESTVSNLGKLKKVLYEMEKHREAAKRLERQIVFSLSKCLRKKQRCRKLKWQKIISDLKTCKNRIYY